MRDKPLVDVTVGISCVGNIPGLQCCLSALASGTAMPRYINLRLESDFPGIDYYLQQVLCAFRFWGTELNVQLAKAEGIHPTRDAQVNNCRTKWMIMLDDDVLPDAALVETYGTVITFQQRFPNTAANDRTVMLQGTKPDLNNTRGYADFELNKVPYPPMHEVPVDFNFNWPHVDSRDALISEASVKMKNHHFCDPGNMMVNVELVRKYGIKFRPFDTMVQRAGGEDTLFAVQCIAKRLDRYWMPGAFVWHLEKPKATTRLTEHAYRKEALLRAAEQLKVFGQDFTRADFERGILAWEKLVTK